jgi:hypothetical protein
MLRDTSIATDVEDVIHLREYADNRIVNEDYKLKQGN